MTAGIYKLEAPLMSPAESERIRRACIAEGLIEQDELLALDDWRCFTA